MKSEKNCLIATCNEQCYIPCKLLAGFLACVPDFGIMACLNVLFFILMC